MRLPYIQLTQEERNTLKKLVKESKSSAKVYRRARGLLELDRGKTLNAVAKKINVSIQVVSTLRDNYKQRGLACLKNAPSGRPPKITEELREKITALACRKPPTGYSRWSLRLLADKVVELGYCEYISHTEVGKILKKRNSNRS